MKRSLHPPSRILKVYTETLTGFSHIHSPDGLITSLTISGLYPSGSFWVLGRLAEGTFQGHGGGEESPIVWVQPAGQLKSRLLDDLLDTSSLLTDSYNLTRLPLPQCVLSSQQEVSPTWRWLISRCLAALEAEAMAPMQEKTQIETIIPKISDNFSTRAPLIWTTDILNPLGRESGLSGV